MVKLCSCCAKQRAALKRPKTLEQVRLSLTLSGRVDVSQASGHSQL